MKHTRKLVLLLSFVHLALSCEQNQSNGVEFENRLVELMRKEFRQFKEEIFMHASKHEISLDEFQLRVQLEKLKNESEKEQKVLKSLEEKIVILDADVKEMKFAMYNLTTLPTGRYLFQKDKKVKWRDAKMYCERSKMRLAVINSEVELEALYDAAPHLEDAYWLGASDIGHTAGDFYWLDDRKVDRWWWDRIHGQPDNFAPGNESAVCLSHLSRGTICDGLVARHNAYFICEL